MERDVWIRGAMVVSILALATLILATPTLIGRPPAELASLPLLIIGMPKNESYFIVYLSAAVLVAVEIGVLTGFITPAGLISSFLTVIVGLVIISVFAFIGAIFLGMFVSHRILSGKGFTPFEQEMLRMRQEIRDLSGRLDAIAERLGVQSGNRKKEP